MVERERANLAPVEAIARLSATVDELSARVELLARELRTERVAVVDRDRRERLVAEVVDGVVELRLSSGADERKPRVELLCFAASHGGELAGGIGVQLWVDGEAVRELTWWADDEQGAAPG